MWFVWRSNTALNNRAKRLALTAIAGKSGCLPDGLRLRMRQVQRDGRVLPGQTTAGNAPPKPLRRDWGQPTGAVLTAVSPDALDKMTFAQRSRGPKIAASDFVQRDSALGGIDRLAAVRAN